MAVGDLATVRAVGGLVASPEITINDFGFRAKTIGATRAGLGTAFQAAVIKNTSGGLLFNHSNAYGVDMLQVVDVLPGTGATVTQQFTVVVGGATGDPLPPKDCAVITWYSDLKGRANRGRSYCSGFNEGSQSAGIWDAGVGAFGVAFVAQMLAIFGPAGTNADWQFVVVSRFLNKVPRVPIVGVPITAGVVRDVVFSQRKRTVGQGR